MTNTLFTIPATTKVTWYRLIFIWIFFITMRTFFKTTLWRLFFYLIKYSWYYGYQYNRHNPIRWVSVLLEVFQLTFLLNIFLSKLEWLHHQHPSKFFELASSQLNYQYRDFVKGRWVFLELQPLRQNILLFIYIINSEIYESDRIMQGPEIHRIWV